MQKINFQDLPSEESPMSASNLNTMQSNVEGAFKSTRGTSAVDTYNQQFLNERIVNIGSTNDNNYKVNFIKSKNLFDKDNTAQMLDNLNINQQTLKIYTDNTCKLAYIKCKPNTTYTISRRTPMTNRFFVATSKDLPENNVELLSCTGVTNNTTASFTITTPENANYIVVRFINNKTSDDYNTYANTIQIELGSTATTYQPFVQKQIIVDNNKFTDSVNVGTEVDSSFRTNVLHSRNLFNKDNTQWYRTANGDFSNTTNNDTARIRTSSFAIKGGKTYIVSGIPSGITLYRVRTYNEYNGTQIDNITPSNNTFTLNSNIKYIHLLFSGNNFTDSTNTLMASANIMLNEGSTALDYEPYVTPSINVDGEEIYNANIMNYSTEEQVIGKWFGKPLYRKVINFGALPNATYKEVNHNISNIDLITKIEAISTGSSRNSTISLPNSISNNLIETRADKTKIVITTSDDRSSFVETYVTLEYTKTTD